MRKILLGVILTLVVVFAFRYYEHKRDDRAQLEASTALIQKELKNVGKLIVTEGSYSQIFNYNASRELMYGFYDARKRALVVVNAKATIAYDLSKIETEIDEVAKTVTIIKIPEPELSIYPEIEYYDVQQDYLNKFQASDHNTIRRRVTQKLRQKIEDSELRTNAENRLISELSKIYILTHSMGWTLKYDKTVIEEESDLKEIRL
jgi:hypothetical protein